MYIVYLLYTEKYRKTYVGYTTDLERRLFEHNVSAAKGYCHRYRPWVVLHVENYESKPEAMKRERFYKSGKGRELIIEMIKVRYPPQAEKD